MIDSYNGKLIEALHLWNRYLERPFVKHLQDSFSPLFLDMYYTLRMLQIHGPQTMTQLSKLLQKSKQHTTQIINQLFETEHALRQNDPKDRRIVRITITPKAETVLNAIRQDEAFWIEVQKKLGEDDFITFCETVDTLIRLLSKFGEDSTL